MATPSMRIDAEAINRERQLRAWSLRDLAEMTGLSVAGLSRLLRAGTTSADSFRRITEAFQDNPPIEGADALLAKKGGDAA